MHLGVARKIDKALCAKVIGKGGNTTSLIQGMLWAARSGANIIAMSLGIDYPGHFEKLHDQVNDPTLDRLITSMALEAYRENITMMGELADFLRVHQGFAGGTLVIGASGNESVNSKGISLAASPPAAGDAIIAVAALGQSPQGYIVANFSNHQVDICAPGVDVLSAIPGGKFDSWNGTSMATPHVAGVAALWGSFIKARANKLEVETLTARLLGTARLNEFNGLPTENAIGTGIAFAPN